MAKPELGLNKKVMAKLFHQTGGRILAQTREVAASRSLRDLADGAYYVTPKPLYISQLASADPEKVEGFYLPIHDQAAARRFGAQNSADFSHWAWRSCGIVDVQMVLKSELGKNFSKNTMDLVHEAQAINGYETSNDRGWRHQSLVELAKRYGLNGWTEKFVPPSQIAKHILANRYVLASIVSQMGGHLLLIYGFNLKDGSIKDFLVHDPNDFSEKGEAKEISKTKFNQLSTRRIIVLENGGKPK